MKIPAGTSTERCSRKATCSCKGKDCCYGGEPSQCEEQEGLWGTGSGSDEEAKRHQAGASWSKYKIEGGQWRDNFLKRTNDGNTR